MSADAECLPLYSTKSLARAHGAKFYFTGHACKDGHVEPRYVSSGHCVACNKISVKSWAADNRERKNELLRKWSAENPERRKAHKGRGESKAETKRAWAARNTDKVRSSSRRYYLKNKDKARQKVRDRYARQAKADGSHCPADIVSIVQAQRGRCAYCRINLMGRYHIDHITALANGGSNHRANLQILCAPCNLRKGTKAPEDYARQVGLLI